MTSLAARIADLQGRFHAGELDTAAFDQALDQALAAPPLPGTWIHGVFDGHHALDGTDDSARSVRPLHGVLSGTALGETLPPVTRDDLPWLAAVLEDVQLATSSEEGVQADLQDVRLHQVRILGRTETVLRIRAILWARVVLGPEELQRPPSVRERPPAREPAVAVEQDGLVVYGPDTRAVEGTGHGQGSGASLGCAALGCVGVPLVVVVVVAIGLVGGPTLLALWLGLLGLVWNLQSRLREHHQWAGRPGCLPVLALFALALLCMGTVSWVIGRDPCLERPAWWLILPALPVLAALAIRSRAGLLLVGLTWSHGVWLWSAVPEAACAVDPVVTAEQPSLVLAVGETLDRLDEATAHDPDADLLEHATHVGGDPRLSLDSALHRPEQWLCGVPIHLSGGLLFEEGGDLFRVEAAPHLRRLGRLLRGVDEPVQVQGHGPESGLSGVRARAVTTWLEERAGVDPGLMTPMGLGDMHPVVHDADLVHYNRRLDVVRPCP